MDQPAFTKETAELNNLSFENEVYAVLRTWVRLHDYKTLLQFNQPLDLYLANDALRDLFLHTQYPFQKLLENQIIADHLGRSVQYVYFDPVTGDPLFSPVEQRIYNFARRLNAEETHVPFRSIHPRKQTEAGDVAAVSTYPTSSEEIRYNSGNHFCSRPANGNVFEENSRRCIVKRVENVHIFFKRGFLADRLQDVKEFTAVMHTDGVSQPQFFVICSRHSQNEGHFGVSLVIMDPANPDFPIRIMVCDTLLKDLPHHPRWWNHFIAAYSNVFGSAASEILEDISHPLQKVNITGDDPYRHDWDCPYYAASMADALADLVKNNTELALNGSLTEVYNAMKGIMQDYYRNDLEIKTRPEIQQVNRLKRWASGQKVINELLTEVRRGSAFEL